ncbi:uncharacterized protein [Primulina eburnea]|uniref:uncharacterized protein n=1 Tax=Primulina eburnea TaxID=1245227 RepID=UPI003C6C151E
MQSCNLRSGRELEAEKSKENEKNEKKVEEDECENGKENKVEESRIETEVERIPILKLTLPYTQRFRKKIIDYQFAKFLEIFEKIYINIPFADTLEQMSNCAKFIKDMMSKKSKLLEFETMKLTEECSAILQMKLPQKLKELGSFTVPCIIGGTHVNKLYVILERLGEVKPTTITLQLTDRSLTYPREIVEDVLVKVDKFIFSAGFLILDMEEGQDAPLIFGRPFLAIGKALIDVHKGELTLRVFGEAVIFDINKAIKGNDEVTTSKSIDIIDSCFDEIGIGHRVEDPL